MVLILCAAALVAAVVVVLGVVAAAHGSGRPALTETARGFAAALEGPGAGARDLAPYLPPGVSPDDPRVRRSVEALRQTFRSGARVSEGRTLGGEGVERGETDIVVMSTTRPGTATSSLTFQWSRRAGGGWGVDLLAR